MCARILAALVGAVPVGRTGVFLAGSGAPGECYPALKPAPELLPPEVVEGTRVPSRAGPSRPSGKATAGRPEGRAPRCGSHRIGRHHPITRGEVLAIRHCMEIQPRLMASDQDDGLTEVGEGPSPAAILVAQIEPSGSMRR